MLLVANRGEIALRVVRSATELGIDTVAVYAEDDADSPHVAAATRAVALTGAGPAAYLDGAALLRAATETGCTLVHPGYGFLSENAEFAESCAAAGVTFVGPDPQVLRVFGDKAAARRAAVAARVPVLPATDGGVTVDAARDFLAAHPGGIVLKALAGGGGRGMRVVRDAATLDDAFRACTTEAENGFGHGALFAEALCDRARHIEVQIVAAADDAGGVRALALGDRDCSVQRRHQKLVEVAPAQRLDATVRRTLHEAAARLCASVGYRGLATVEFLVAGDQAVFLEVNPRIQVEHTVTEEVTGIDLVATQVAIARGARFGELGLPGGVTADGAGVRGEPAAAQGIAVQARVNTETMRPDGRAVPASGTLTAFTPPTGPGIRVDTYGRPGLTTSPRYDSLLAKVITHTRIDDFAAALRKTDAALGDLLVAGVATNTDFLQNILRDKDFAACDVHTSWLDERIADLAVAGPDDAPVVAPELHAGEEAVRADMVGTVVETAADGDALTAGAPVVVLEAMKMQHVVSASGPATVVRLLVRPGQTVQPGGGARCGARRVRRRGHRRRGRAGPRRRTRRPRRDPGPARAHPRRRPPRRRGQTAPDRPPHRAGEHRRPRRRRHLRRVRAARARRAAQPAQRRGPDRQHPPPTASSAVSPASTAPNRWCSPTTTPSSPARRACATTPRPTGCSSSPHDARCRSCCSPRAAADAPATSTPDPARAWNCRRSGRWPPCAGACRRSRWSPVGASPATPPSPACATC